MILFVSNQKLRDQLAFFWNDDRFNLVSQHCEAVFDRRHMFNFSGCGFWTSRNDFFNSHFTPGSDSSGEPFLRGPLMEGFIRFWTFIIILQVCLLHYSTEVILQ